MSEEYTYVEIEETEYDSDRGSENTTRNRNQSSNLSDAEKRAHHNALERRRRDQIKNSFTLLKESVPALQDAQTSSRAEILLKTSRYIQSMSSTHKNQQQSIEELKKQNMILESQIAQLERSKQVVSFSNSSPMNESDESDMDDYESISPKRPMFKSTRYSK